MPVVSTDVGHRLPEAPLRILAIAVGGSLGTLARYGVERSVTVPIRRFPWPTLSVNVAGSFLLGVVITLVVERWPPTRFVRPFAAIGFCGGFTTFSTMVVEATQRGQHGHAGLAAGYLAASLVLGVVAAAVGMAAARGRFLPPYGQGDPGPRRHRRVPHERTGGRHGHHGGRPVIILGLLVAGACGAVARYLVDRSVQERIPSDFPVGILLVNLTGALVLGILTGSAVHHGLSSRWLTVDGTGFIGSYTTFSTFTFDSVRLAENGQWGYSLINVVVSLVAGVAAAAAGLALGSLT